MRHCLLVPEDHLLRKINKAVDFSFIYKELQPYYAKNGKMSIDPVVIIKALLIGFLYGITSERRLEQELKYNVAYRWFLGLSFEEKTPDHSTFSQLRRRKFNDADIFKKLFIHILKTCSEANLVSGKLLVTDSTHVKANASQSSRIKIKVEKAASSYLEMLDAEEAKERKNLGTKEIKREHTSQEVLQTKSKTDPDAGWLSRPGKPKGFHYLSNQIMDAENGVITNVEVTPSNTNDSETYVEQVDIAF